jgi:hypothetical protein
MRLHATSIASIFVFVGAAFSQGSSAPAARCNESVFKPCICAKNVPETIKYRPSLAACGGKAAAILEGEYGNSFSVVLRDRENRDRYPASGFNGCSKAEADLGLAKCSAYKCQKVTRKNGKLICCFGGSGDSAVLSKASRMTIKLRDVPGSSDDPLLRVCLNRFSPRVKLN